SGNVDVLTEGRPIVLRHDHAHFGAGFGEIGIQHLRHPNRYALTGLTLSDADTRYTNNILPHVIDVHARTDFANALRFQCAIDSRRVADLTQDLQPIVGERMRLAEEVAVF